MSVILDLTGNVLKADGFAQNTTVQIVTATGNAATLTSRLAQVTVPSLSTAAGGSQAIVLTLAGITSADFASASISGGTNTTWAGVTCNTVCTANTITSTIYNGNAAALNGTIILNVIAL